MQPTSNPPAFSPLTLTSNPAAGSGSQPSVTRALTFTPAALEPQNQAPLTFAAYRPHLQYGYPYAMQPQPTHPNPPGQMYAAYGYNYAQSPYGAMPPAPAVLPGYYPPLPPSPYPPSPYYAHLYQNVIPPPGASYHPPPGGVYAPPYPVQPLPVPHGQIPASPAAPPAGPYHQMHASPLASQVTNPTQKQNC